MTPSGYEEFQKGYDDDGDRELAVMSGMPVAMLLERARAGKFSPHFQLWTAIAAKASLKEAGWALLDVLKSDADYLNRYHCANALIKLAGGKLSQFQAVMLSAPKVHPVRENLEQAREILTAMVGART